MAIIDLGSYKNIYIQTAKEYVDKISASLDTLSSDHSNKEALNNLHIASHSLKSQSQAMGYNDIAQLSKSLEEISNNALLGNNPLTDNIIVEIKEFCKELEEILKRVQAFGSEDFDGEISRTAQARRDDSGK